MTLSSIRHLVLRHLLLLAVVAASLWLLAGFVLIDQRWQYPYDDGSWGTMYFFGQAVAHLILLPGFSAADALGDKPEPFGRWLIASVVSVLLALIIERLLHRLLAARRLPTD